MPERSDHGGKRNFHRSAMYGLLARINTYLMRWVRKKYRQLRALRVLRKEWDRVTATYSEFFVHWSWVSHPLMVRTIRAEWRETVTLGSVGARR